MPLKFYCKECGSEIIVKYLKVDEMTKCRSCGAENDIPELAVETDKEPSFSTVGISSGGIGIKDSEVHSLKNTYGGQTKGIQVKCFCGAQYNLKDKFAGSRVKCTQCGSTIKVPGKTILHQGDPVFNRDKFLLRQKHLAISQKYYVWDEEGNTIMFIQRPRHLMRNVFAILFGILCGYVTILLLLPLATLMDTDVLMTIYVVTNIVLFITVTFIVICLLYKKRHITFYRDDSKREKLLEILQNKKVEIITATYTLLDSNYQLLATFRKNFLYNIFRRRWYCYAPDGSILCIAKEDSIILSLLRKVLGSFFGLLKINFIIMRRESDDIIGELNRKFTILDRYVLDMTGDPSREIDRRIALALGVLLDSGERR
ncbi:MAG: hypothetical protein P9X24_10460 [Candidatus Hatepunaea meridiana]|nr:hypothetical protein [Candidatus Hatepunaea meridiana]